MVTTQSLGGTAIPLAGTTLNLKSTSSAPDTKTRIKGLLTESKSLLKSTLRFSAITQGRGGLTLKNLVGSTKVIESARGPELVQKEQITPKGVSSNVDDHNKVIHAAIKNHHGKDS